MRRLLLAGLVVAAAAGCDRIPIDPVRTELVVAEPDLGVVFVDPAFRLVLRPDGPTRPLTVRIRTKLVDFDSTLGAFVYERSLSYGLNAFALEVTDEAGAVERDTLYALHLPFERTPLLGVDEGTPRAGAAVAPLGPGAVYVSGGVDAAGAARATGAVVSLANARFQAEDRPLGAARTGHTATPVGSGVLLLGGTTVAAPTGPADFVRLVEWVGPDGVARPVAVAGAEEGPARAGHVARAVATGGETYVYLLGGRTPTASGAAVSDAVEVFRVTGTDVPDDPPGLERLSPDGGAGGFAALADAALAPTAPADAAVFGLADGEPAALAVGWTLPGTSTYPFSLRVRPAGSLATPRAAAAAVDLGGGLALVIGGRGADGAALGTLEVYAAAADRTFRFPDGFGLAVPRSEHVATILRDGRILVIGGRPAGGAPTVAAEAFRL